MLSSMASVPVDCAIAGGAAPAANKKERGRQYLWNRSNIAPLTLRIGFSGFGRGHVLGLACFMQYTLMT
jgi:hypothetical protein